MAVAIDKFQSRFDRGFEGQLAKGPVFRVQSGVNEGAEPIKFGRFIAMDGTQSGVANLAASSTIDDVIGVSVREVAAENTIDKVAVYEKGHVVNYVTDEVVFVIVQGAATRGGKVHAEIKGAKELGSVSAAKSADNIEVNATFMEDAADGALVPIKLGALLG